MEQQTSRGMGSNVPEPNYEKEREPLLTIIGEQLSKEVERQSEIANKIQSALHGILNKRVPDKDEPTPRIPSPNHNDVVGGLRQVLGRIENNNMLLERILNHLSEII